MIKYLAQTLVDTSHLPQTGADNNHLNAIFYIVLGIMGALAFFMLIIAAFRYTISQGEPEKVAGAKRTIIYSLTGIVIIAMAATIVKFVISKT